jgi:DNA-directed RNA polymerase beta' subunit
MAWTLFGPLVIREVGAEQEVLDRTERAARRLDEIMARSWLIVNRAPTVIPTSILAFHPVRVMDNTIRIHPLACMLLNADFDGDQTAVYLPVTSEGQEEAGRLLSVAGHLRRDPSIIGWLFPNHESLWGLAQHSMTPDGLAQIEAILGLKGQSSEGYVTRDALTQALRAVMERDGADRVLDIAQQIQSLGLDVAKASGASISPFLGQSVTIPPAPDTDDPAVWSKYVAEIGEALISRDDFSNNDLGPQLLAIKGGARGGLGALQRLVGPTTVSSSIHGNCVPIRHGFSEGLTPQEMFTCVVGAREGLQKLAIECTQAGYGFRGYSEPRGFTVLNRAIRAKHPGIVFARAAAIGETDPLADTDSRLFVGMPVE